MNQKCNQKLVFFHLKYDIHYSNRSDIKITTGGKTKQKYTIYCLHFGTLGARRTHCNACNDLFNLLNHFTADNGMRTVSIDCYACHCVPQSCRMLSKCKQICSTFVLFSPCSDLNIQPILVCHISNGRKQVSE